MKDYPPALPILAETSLMKKLILTYGSIAGIIVAALMALSIAFKEKMALTTGMIFGYASMLIAFVMIFIAVKQYRDSQLGGSISFGKAFLIGLGITLIASTIYALTWELEYRFLYPDFMDQYNKQALDQLNASGASPADIAAATKEGQKMAEMYRNPLFRIPMTFAEIFPVGLVVSLVAALILRKRV